MGYLLARHLVGAVRIVAGAAIATADASLSAAKYGNIHTGTDLYGLNKGFEFVLLETFMRALSQRFHLLRSSSSIQSNRQQHWRINLTKENQATA